MTFLNLGFGIYVFVCVSCISCFFFRKVFIVKTGRQTLLQGDANRNVWIYALATAPTYHCAQIFINQLQTLYRHSQISQYILHLVPFKYLHLIKDYYRAVVNKSLLDAWCKRRTKRKERRRNQSKETKGYTESLCQISLEYLGTIQLYSNISKKTIKSLCASGVIFIMKPMDRGRIRNPKSLENLSQSGLVISEGGQCYMGVMRRYVVYWWTPYRPTFCRPHGLRYELLIHVRCW